MGSSFERFWPLWAALLGPLLVGACQTPAPGLRQADIPAGRKLVPDGLAAGGRLLVAVGDCGAPEVWQRGADGWQQSDANAARAGGACPPMTAGLAPDGRTLAVYDHGAGRAVLFELAEGRLKPGGTARLAAPAGFAFPPPGPNLAFTTDGGRLLLGAPNRGCRRLAAGGIACGTAELLERRGTGWERRAAFPPPAEEDGTVRFGQSVALSPDGSLALVGGTGEVGRSGALWLFAVDGAEPRLVQMLAPERRDGWFGNDVALSGDGRRLAVGGEQAVWLYEREGEGFALRKRLTAPDLEAGHFGETVALSRDGRMLLVGAPRTACDAGERCGIAYLFEHDGYWRLARTIRPSVSQADADFGHHIALDPDGRHLAVQGAALHVFTLTER